jgi:hypothetical protein
LFRVLEKKKEREDLGSDRSRLLPPPLLIRAGET